MFKAQNGIISNKYAPVVKKVKETTIKLTPLDIQTNDYLADLFDDKEEVLSEKALEADKSQSSHNAYPDVKDNEYADDGYGNHMSKHHPSKTSNKFLPKGKKEDQEKSLFTNVDKNVRSAGNSKTRKSRPLTSKGKRNSKQSNDPPIDPYTKLDDSPPKQPKEFERVQSDNESDHARSVTEHPRNLINLKNRKPNYDSNVNN